MTGIVFSADGKLLVSISWDGHLMVWDVLTGERRRDLRLSSEALQAVALVPGSSIVAAGGADAEIRLIDFERGEQVASWPSRHGQVLCVAVSPDGKSIAAGTQKKAAEVWDSRGKLRFSAADFISDVNAVAFSIDGKTLAAGSAGDHLRLLNAMNGQPSRQLGFPGWVYSLAYSSANGALAAGGSMADTQGRESGELRIWKNPSEDQSARSHPHSIVCYRLAFSNDGKFYATAGNIDSSVKLWDVDTNAMVAELRGHIDGVTAVAFDPSGVFLASGSRDKTIRLWSFTKALSR